MKTLNPSLRHFLFSIILIPSLLFAVSAQAGVDSDLNATASDEEMANQQSPTRTGGIGGTGHKTTRTGGIGGTGKNPELPELGNIPQVPEVPNIPVESVPDINIPNIPSLGVPTIPAAGSVPDIPLPADHME